MKKVVFLDRDGVINYDSPDYIKSPEEFEFLPGSVQAIADLYRNGFSVIVITNQSAIGRNLISERTLSTIHQKMTDTVEKAGGKIADIFYCPHHPDEHCGCRKPRTGMIFAAAKKHQIEISDSGFVGDNPGDMLCARAAGCKYAILVLTGSGEDARIILDYGEPALYPNFKAKNLLEASKWIISNESSRNRSS